VNCRDVDGVHAGGTRHGLFTDSPGVLTDDLFVKLLAPGVEWTAGSDEHVYVRREVGSDDVKWTATPAPAGGGRKKSDNARISGVPVRARPRAHRHRRLWLRRR
jgi:hypothetical protein